MSETAWEDVENEAARLESEEGFSGILRASRGDEVLLESCHGMANRADAVPVTPRTRFGTASLSKMFTAIGVLDAVGRGEVSLDAPVVEVLPEGKRPNTLRDDVLVHHLLSHTSGIADYFEEDENLPGYKEDFGALWEELPTYRVRDYTALVPLFADLPPAVYPAGSWEIAPFRAQIADAFEMGAFPPPVANAGDECYISDHVDIAIGLNAASPNGQYNI